MSMSLMHLAMYKGPASSRWDRFRHWCIRFWTNHPYSHCELLIDGICYSSSARDGGVRCKVIDTGSGHWDLYEIEGNKGAALEWFIFNQGCAYDWAGIARFVFPFLPHRSRQWFCFEAIGAMLGLPNPEDLDAPDLMNALPMVLVERPL
jgi:hypothetical protein